MALSSRIPVVYCNDSEYFVLCEESGCRRFEIMDMWDSALALGTVVLVDSNQYEPDVPVVFALRRSKGYVVHATRPQRSDWHEWTKERNGRIRMLGLWSRGEVQQLQSVKHLRAHLHGSSDIVRRELYEESGDYAWKDRSKTYSPSELFDLLGPSAGTCFHKRYIQAKKTGDPVADFEHNFDEDYRMLFLDPEALLLIESNCMADGRRDPSIPSILLGDAFRRFYYRVPNDNPFALHLFHDIPTPLLRRLLVRAFREEPMWIQRQFAERIAYRAQFARYFFAQIVTDQLETAGEAFNCFYPSSRSRALY